MKSTAILFAALAVTVGVTAPAGATGAVDPGGEAPLADAGLDQQVSRGSVVLLDATGSRDPDGRITRYDWRIETPSGQVIGPLDPDAARTRFVATEEGVYAVVLTVTDDEGNTATDTLYVTVGRERRRSPAVNPTTGTPPTTGPPGAVGTESVPSATVTSVDVQSRTTSRCGSGYRWFSGLGGCLPTVETDPWLGLDGPTVTKVGETYYYTAETDGFGRGADLSYDWSVSGASGRTAALHFDSRGTYTVEVTVSDDRGRSLTDEKLVYVAPAGNRRPEVEIARPDDLVAGETVTLDLREKRDPDGFVVDVEWSPARTVTVPDDGDSIQVDVTVTDDDGVSVSDFVILTGEVTNITQRRTDTTDVTCYYSSESQRESGYAPRCLIENGNTAAQSVGPSQLRTFQREPKIDLHWRKLSSSRIDQLRANDTSTTYGTAMADLNDTDDRYGFSDDLVVRKVSSQSKARPINEGTVRIHDKSISDDVNNDGEVNAADWDQAYRTTGDEARDDRDQVVAERVVQRTHGQEGGEESDGTIDMGGQATATSRETTTAESHQSSTLDSDRIGELNARTSSSPDTGSDKNTEPDSGRSSSPFHRIADQLTETTDPQGEESNDSTPASGSSDPDEDCSSTQGGFTICF